MKLFSLRTIGIFFLAISIMYPLNLMLQNGYTLARVLFGDVSNYALLRDISFVIGIILIIISFFKKKSKKR